MSNKPLEQKSLKVNLFRVTQRPCKIIQKVFFDVEDLMKMKSTSTCENFDKSANDAFSTSDKVKPVGKFFFLFSFQF